MAIATERRAEVSVTVGGREITFETGKLAKQADGYRQTRPRKVIAVSAGAPPQPRVARPGARPAGRVHALAGGRDLMVLPLHLDADLIRSGVAGMDAVVYLVHSMESGDFMDKDRKAAQQVAAACEDAGVGRLPVVSRTDSRQLVGIITRRDLRFLQQF